MRACAPSSTSEPPTTARAAMPGRPPGQLPPRRQDPRALRRPAQSLRRQVPRRRRHPHLHLRPGCLAMRRVPRLRALPGHPSAGAGGAFPEPFGRHLATTAPRRATLVGTVGTVCRAGSGLYRTGQPGRVRLGPALQHCRGHGHPARRPLAQKTPATSPAGGNIPVIVECWLGGASEEWEPYIHFAHPLVTWRALQSIAAIPGVVGIKEYYGLIPDRVDVNLAATGRFFADPNLSENPAPRRSGQALRVQPVRRCKRSGD